MSHILSRPGFRNLLFELGIGLMLFSLIRYPDVSLAAARDGLTLCLNVIIPSLFPFFVLSTLCVELGLIQALERLFRPLMEPLFQVNGACAGAYLLGIVGGYPVGARTVISLYEGGHCSRTEAERMLSFCNNSGPAFILGVVGAGIFSSGKAGLWLYGTHVASSLLVGILFRNYRRTRGVSREKKTPQIKPEGFSAAFPRAVKAAFDSALSISAFVIFFTVFLRMLFQAGIISGLAAVCMRIAHGDPVTKQLAESLITGAIEMTSGVWSLRDAAASMGDRLCMAAFILGWAGLSVHCQVLSFIGNSGLSTRTYFAGKLLHGLFSAGILWLISLLFHRDIPVSLHLANEIQSIAEMNFAGALTISASAALGIFALLFWGHGQIFKMDSGNSAKKHV